MILFIAALLSIEYSKEGIDQILGEHVRFVQQDGDFIVHHDGQENLLEKCVGILNGGTVDLKEWAFATIFVFKVGCVFLGELSLTQALCPTHHEERSNTSFVLCFSIKGKLTLYLVLTDK